MIRAGSTFSLARLTITSFFKFFFYRKPQKPKGFPTAHRSIVLGPYSAVLISPCVGVCGYPALQPSFLLSKGAVDNLCPTNLQISPPYRRSARRPPGRAPKRARLSLAKMRASTICALALSGLHLKNGPNTTACARAIAMTSSLRARRSRPSSTKSVSITGVFSKPVKSNYR